MQKVLKLNRIGNLRLIEETLPEGSTVYDVYVGDQKIICSDEIEANAVFSFLKGKTIIPNN
jgi:hypothetical protein